MVVITKETDLPKMQEEIKQEPVKEVSQESALSLSLDEILIGLEQRILNVEAALFRIKGVI